MKILVIGGSYFFGRVFVLQAVNEHEITAVNRGTYPMGMPGVRPIVGDRRDPRVWESITEDFDVLVDFCGYEKGDIRMVLERFPGTVRQYIFISTVDVYAHGGNGLRDEASPLEKEITDGEAGRYITGKIALEQELAGECAKRGIPYTVLRPAILYGPYNYAPRESAFIRLIVREGILVHITDARGRFQFVYVKDAAEAVLRCLLNEKAYGQIFNVCNEAVLDYDLFFEELKKAADMPFREIAMTAGEAARNQIPLPFPLTEAENGLCTASRSREELGMRYTEISEGMPRAWRAFKHVFEA